MKTPFSTLSPKKTFALIILIFVAGCIAIANDSNPQKVLIKEPYVDNSIDPPKPGTTDYCLFLHLGKSDFEMMAKVINNTPMDIAEEFAKTVPRNIWERKIGEPIIRFGEKASVYCINYSLIMEYTI